MHFTARRWLVLTVAGTAAVVLTACSSSKGSHPTSTAPTVTVTSSATSAASPAPTASSSSAPTGTTSASVAPKTTSNPPLPGPSGGAVPAGFSPTSSSFVSAAEGWVLGTAPCSAKPCTSVVRTTDGGRSWTGIPAPKVTLGTPGQQTTTSEVSLLRFADPNNGWAAGGALYSTHNGGATWTKLQVGPAGSAVTTLATGGGYVYAAVDSCPDLRGCKASTTLYASPIGTDRFTALGLTVEGQIVPAILAVHGSDWFVAGAANGAQRVYHGRALAVLTSVTAPCAHETGVSGIAAADASHLDLMCEGQGAAGSATWQLYGSTDGGAKWSTAGPSHRLPTGLAAMSDNGAGALLVAAASGASELLRTTDDGGKFDSVLDAGGGGTFWGDAGFTTASQAIAVLPGMGAWLSHDAGASWARITF